MNKKLINKNRIRPLLMAQYMGKVYDTTVLMNLMKTISTKIKELPMEKIMDKLREELGPFDSITMDAYQDIINDYLLSQGKQPMSMSEIIGYYTNGR
jgi:hypothetical protein